MVRHGEPSVHGFPSLPPPETKVVVVAQDGETDAAHSSAAATGPATRFMSFFIPKPLCENVDVKIRAARVEKPPEGGSQFKSDDQGSGGQC